MKKAEKLLALFLVLTVLLSLCGCGSAETAEEAAPEPTEAPTETPEPTPEPTSEPTPTPEPTPEPTPVPTVNTYTSFKKENLKNWNDEALREAYGVDGYQDFHPKDPQPRTYIVSAPEVIDPVTGRISEGGYNHNHKRHLPISTDDLLYKSGRLHNGGLTLTGDPDEATYILVLSFDYKYNPGTFRFSDGSRITQYHPGTRATLYNLVTTRKISTDWIKTFATYTNESVYKSMLEAAKGKQLYGQSAEIDTSDFKGYWEFIAQNEKDLPLTPESLVIVEFPEEYHDDLKETGRTKKVVSVRKVNGAVRLVLTEAQRINALQTTLAEIEAKASDPEMSGLYRPLSVSPEEGKLVFETELSPGDEELERIAREFKFLARAYLCYAGDPRRNVSVVFQNPDGEPVL